MEMKLVVFMYFNLLIFTAQNSPYPINSAITTRSIPITRLNNASKTSVKIKPTFRGTGSTRSTVYKSTSESPYTHLLQTDTTNSTPHHTIMTTLSLASELINTIPRRPAIKVVNSTTDEKAEITTRLFEESTTSKAPDVVSTGSLILVGLFVGIPILTVLILFVFGIGYICSRRRKAKKEKGNISERVQKKLTPGIGGYEPKNLDVNEFVFKGMAPDLETIEIEIGDLRPPFDEMDVTQDTEGNATKVKFGVDESIVYGVPLV